VCESLDESSIMSMLPSPNNGSSADIEIYDSLEFDFTPEDTVHAIGCTYSTGPKASRISIELIEKDSPQSGSELMTDLRNRECDRLDDVVFVDCDNQYWLTSTQQLGPVNVTIKGYSFGDTEDSKDVYKDKMLDLHHIIGEYLTESGKVDEADIQADDESTTGTLSSEDACVFSYEEVNDVFSFDGFTTSSTTDDSEWVTAFGEEVLEAGCSYERDGEFSSANKVTGLTVHYRPYTDDPDSFYSDRDSGYDDSCQTLKGQSHEVFDIDVTCIPGDEADIVISGLMAVVFLDDFGWQIDAYGTIEADSVNGLKELADLIAKRDPGDQRAA
jgi:hypothetical protein